MCGCIVGAFAILTWSGVSSFHTVGNEFLPNCKREKMKQKAIDILPQCHSCKSRDDNSRQCHKVVLHCIVLTYNFTRQTLDTLYHGLLVSVAIRRYSDKVPVQVQQLLWGEVVRMACFTRHLRRERRRGRVRQAALWGNVVYYDSSTW